MPQVLLRIMLLVSISWAGVAYSQTLPSARAISVLGSLCETDVCRRLLDEAVKDGSKSFATWLSSTDPKYWMTKIQREKREANAKFARRLAELNSLELEIEKATSLEELEVIQVLIREKQDTSYFDGRHDDMDTLQDNLQTIGAAFQDAYGRTGLSNDLAMFGLTLEHWVGEEAGQFSERMASVARQLRSRGKQLFDASNVRAARIVAEGLRNTPVPKPFTPDASAIKNRGGIIGGRPGTTARTNTPTTLGPGTIAGNGQTHGQTQGTGNTNSDVSTPGGRTTIIFPLHNIPRERNNDSNSSEGGRRCIKSSTEKCLSHVY